MCRSTVADAWALRPLGADVAHQRHVVGDWSYLEIVEHCADGLWVDLEQFAA